jgi:hypothetical protein
MDFWASAEAFQAAFPALDGLRRCVEPLIDAAFEVSGLAELKGELRYVPIVMPEGMRERYPARSKFRKKQLIYSCAPQLNYEVL